MKRLAPAMLVIAALATAGCGSSDEGTSGDSASSTPSFLTVIQAEGGTLSPQGDHLELTLRGVGSQVAAFSDRPDRISGAIETRSFIDGWASEYDGDPPNAALTLLDADKHADTQVLTLEEPEHSGGTLTFRARRISDPGEELEQFDDMSDDSVARRFDAASLFIDGGGLMQLVAYGAQDVYLTG
jgi:hypothetical protein